MKLLISGSKRMGIEKVIELLLLTIPIILCLIPSAIAGTSENTTFTNQSNRDVFSQLKDISEQLGAATVFAIEQTIIALFVGVGIIVATISIYWHQQSSDKKNTTRHATDGLLRELKEIKYTMLSESSRTHHPTEETKTGAIKIQKDVNYTNTYMATDAYDSVLFSGLLTHFTEETQYTLSKLYSRITSHNELIKYIYQLEDNFSLKQYSGDLHLKLQQTIDRYELRLTTQEIEIISLIYDSIRLIETEKK